MPDKISWSFKANVTGGPSMTVDGLLPIEAYDKIDALVPKNDGTNNGVLTLAVQPASALFLVIAASAYSTDKPLTYQIGDKGKTAPSHTLDSPHILIGSGAVSLLGDTQKSFTFTNSSDVDVTVSILVGRQASS